MHASLSTHKQPNIWAPYMVVNPGENLLEAMERHRRETGHRGGCIVVAINTGH